MKSIPLNEETAALATQIIWFEPPPGIIDPRSWDYWNSKMGRYPPPPLPVRRFGSTVGPSILAFAQAHENGNPDLVRKLSLEEIRRRAREEWRAKYGPGEKS